MTILQLAKAGAVQTGPLKMTTLTMTNQPCLLQPALLLQVWKKATPLLTSLPLVDKSLYFEQDLLIDSLNNPWTVFSYLFIQRQYLASTILLHRQVSFWFGFALDESNRCLSLVVDSSNNIITWLASGCGLWLLLSISRRRRRKQPGCHFSSNRLCLGLQKIDIFAKGFQSIS
jgi:hypothetical protein